MMYVASGGTLNSLFGDDLYEYLIGKHNRPPLKPYLAAWSLCSSVVMAWKPSLRGVGDCNIIYGHCVGFGLLFTPREACRKVNHFRLNPMEYLYSSCGGRCSYAIGRPVIALEIRLTHSWGIRFSVHLQRGEP